MLQYQDLVLHNTGVINEGCLRNKSWKPECVGSFNMDWRIKFTNISQSMLKLKTHSCFHDLFRDSAMSKSTNTVVYFDWKTVIYIYACRNIYLR